MDIKGLNQEFEKIKENIELFYKSSLPYADIDVEGLYNTIKPSQQGFISDKEIENVKDFLGLTGNETKEELIGIRNSIVKYYAQQSELFYEKPRKEHTQKEIENHFIMQDQMSAFTSVIDSITPSTEETNIEEAFTTSPKILGTIVQYENGFNVQDEHKKDMLIKNYASLKKLLIDLANNL